jgi:hypothetical protein
MSKLLYQIKARFVKIEVIGDTPDGERKNFHYMGEVFGGELQGTLRGIDYALTREGVVQAHIHEVLTMERRGSSVSVDDPDLVVIKGEGLARTASAQLAWLNEATISWSASLNRNTVEFTAEVYQV